MFHATPPHGFRGLGIAPVFVSSLERLAFSLPTPIQHQSIPVAIEGKDIIGIAQTGTGKTLAFGIPLLQRLSQGDGHALIVLPTRELAYQVEEALQPFADAVGIRLAVFVGGASMQQQRQMLKRHPRVLIATPGRLNDHLEQRTVSLRTVTILVLDEADRMLDMGFKPQIDRILQHVPKERQTLLFSATMPQAIVSLATREMRLPLRIEVAPAGTAAAKVEQELCIVRREDKNALLLALLQEHPGSVLVFSRTKHGAKKIARTVSAAGHSVAEIHANRSLPQRRAALEGFKRGTYRVLVATDIAARGIDVTGIAVVLNYDLPNDPADYVHRIGRTARAGREGRAISFATPDQSKNIRAIERLMRAPLKRSTRSSASMLSPDAPASPAVRPAGGSRHTRSPRRRRPGGDRGPRQGRPRG
jgi:ATP-dependent RNA helicase RhlE